MDMILGLSVDLNIVSLFSVTYIVGTHRTCLIEAIPMCTYKICLSNNYVFHHKFFLNKFSTTSIASLKCACRNQQVFM